MANKIRIRKNYRIRKNNVEQKKTARVNKKHIDEKKIISRKKNRVEKKEIKIRRNTKNNYTRETEQISVKGSSVFERIKEYCSDKKILIVGNSSEIITENIGEKIDSYDVVIRMNHGHPKEEYIKQMGRKYNIWSHGFLSKKGQIKAYSNIKDVIDFHIETCERKLCKDIYDEKCFLIPGNWYKKEYEKRYRHREMSTGLNTIIFFTNYIFVIKSISIVGFDFLRTGNSILGSRVSPVHNSEIEEKTTMNYLLDCGKYLPFNEKYDYFETGNYYCG